MSDYTPDGDYTPNEQELIEGSTVSEDERRRAIALIKADALREAAEATSREAAEEPYAGALFTTYADWLEERADRIEREAGR